MVWAVVVSLVLALFSFLAMDIAASTLLTALAELAAVFALFTLVCAAEAWN